MNRYLKLFMAAGIPYGVITGICYSITHGISTGIVSGLVAGILFGALMSVVLNTIHTLSVNRISYSDSKNKMGVHHLRNIELRLSYDMAFDLCIESLCRIKKCTIRKEDRSGGRLTAKAGMTWKTFGDIISFELHRTGDDRIRIQVSSRPLQQTTLVDFGKNLDNVERIVEFLNTHGA